MKDLESKEEYDTTLSDNNVVVIDFYTTWCGPCKMLSPVIDAIAEEYEKKQEENQEETKKKIAFLRGDCDKVAEVADTLEIKSVPTVVFFCDGKEVHRIVGFGGKKEKYTDKIDECLSGKAEPADEGKKEKVASKKKSKDKK